MPHIQYYIFNVTSENVDGSSDYEQVYQAGETTIYCKFMYDDDDISDTYGHWIAVLDLVSDDIDIPQRSIVLNPNTMHFEGDEHYSVVITSDLPSIGYYDLPQTVISIGVYEDE